MNAECAVCAAEGAAPETALRFTGKQAAAGLSVPWEQRMMVVPAMPALAATTIRWISAISRWPQRVPSLPPADTVLPESAAVAYGCPDTVPDTGELTLYLPDGTYSGTMLVDGQLKTFSSLTVPGDTQSAVSLTDTGVQMGLPNGTELPLETDGADVVLPAGSTVQAGSGPVMPLPAGSTVSESGPVTGPVVQMVNTTECLLL